MSRRARRSLQNPGREPGRSGRHADLGVKARLILISSMNTNRESVAYQSFRPSEFEAIGVRKVTTGITGLWQPSVHGDVAF